jgi:predicted MFS family arabinose efflux permease
MGGQYAGGKLTNRVSPARGLAGIFAVLAVLALLFIPVTAPGVGLLPVVTLCGVLGFFLFAIQPFYQNAVAIYTPPDARGLSYGYTYLAEFGFGATSIALGGFVLGELSQTAFFAMIAGFAVVGGLLGGVLLAGSGRFVPAEGALEAEADD